MKCQLLSFSMINTPDFEDLGLVENNRKLGPGLSGLGPKPVPDLGWSWALEISN